MLDLTTQGQVDSRLNWQLKKGFSPTDTANKPTSHEDDNFTGALGVLEGATDGFVACDSEFRIIYLNSAAERLYGKSKPELLGRTPWEASSDLAGSELEHEVRRVLAERVAGTLECYHRNLACWLELRVLPAAGGGVSIWLWDITERKRAEEALIEERHLLHAFMDNLPDVIYFKDRESRFTWINKTSAKLFGLRDPAQAVGKTDFDFFIPKHAQKSYNDEQEMIRTGHPIVDKEEKETWPDGHVTWALTTKMPLRDTSGNIIGTFGVSRNVTKRKLAETENKRLAVIVNSSEDAIFSVTREGLIVTWNAGAEHIYGYTGEEIKGKHITILIPEDRRGDLAVNCEKLYRGEAFLHYEFEHRRKDGSRLHVSETLSPIKDATGVVTAVSVISRDITERKRAEEALRESEERFRELAEMLPGIVVEIDAQGKVTFANRQAFAITGYSEEDFLQGFNAHQFFAPEDRERAARDIQGTRSGEPDTYKEYIGQRKDGTRFNVAARSAACIHAGQIVVHSIVMDITQQKLKEAALRESEERYRRLVEQMGEGVLTTDFDERIIVANPAACGLFGMADDTLVGRSLQDFVSPETFAYLRQQTLLRRQGEKSSYEFEIIRPDGECRHVLLTATPSLDKEDHATGTFGICRDITECKVLERSRREQLHFLQRLVDAVPTPIFQKDRQARYQMCNKAFEQFFGLSKEAIIGKTVLDIMPPEVARSYNEKDLSLVREPCVKFYEGRLFRADGACRDFVFNKASLVDERGAIEGVACGMVDITEQKQALEALRRSEERTAILNQVANAFLTIHSEEVYGEVLAVVLRVLGCPFGLYGYIEDNGNLAVPSMTREIWDRCQVPDKSIVFPPESWGESIWGKAIRDKKAYCSTGPFRVPEGHVSINNCLAVPILFGGETIGLITVANKEGGFTEDDQSLVESICGYISPILQARLQREQHEQKRQHAEEALRKSEERFKQVVESAGEWVWEVDVNGLYLYSSPVVEEILGYRPEELIGKVHFYDLFAPDVREEFMARVSGLFACRQPAIVIPAPKVRKDGSIAFLETNGVPVLGESGELRGYRGTSRDVTERMRVEGQLRKLSRAVEQCPASVVITDLEGCIEYVNPKFTAVTGYTLEEVAGKNSRVLNARLAPDETYGETWNTLLSGREWRGEFANRRKSGEIFWESASILPIKDSQGKITHILAVKEDITARKHLEDQFRQAQRMEAIGRLAGGIAHDFNNLLTVINGYCSLLLRELKDGDPLRESVAEIQKAGEQAASLTRQLLMFSRKQIAEPRPLDLNQLIGENLGMLQRLVGEDIAVETQLAPSLGTVVADPGQIHQVLMNLAVNARDAMPRGGSFTLTTSNADVNEGDSSQHPGIAPGRYVLFSAVDTGTGIEAEALEHIFDPFFTTKGKGEGTGLGLATVYGIVQQAGGLISVHSQPGCGATFLIYLPRTKASVSAHHETAQAPAAPRGTETVLVVEDQDPVRKLTVRILKRHGYRTLEAAQGDEALLLAESYSEPIHLLLTDVVMPGMTGPELAKRLKPLRPAMKVLYVSGYAADVITHRGLLEPGQILIAKPFASEDLALRVREALGAGPAPAGGSVLVVDDESQVRTLFQKVLAGAGYKVQIAKDGDYALKMVREQRFDVVVVDLVMPEREGIDIIQTMRKERPDLKIIAVSGAFGGAFLKVAKLLGANVALAKPVDPDQLLSVIRDVLG